MKHLHEQSAAGKELALVAYGSYQWTGGRITLLDLGSGKELRASPSHEGDVTALAFSPDGKFLASAGFGWSLRLWDFDSMKELRAAPTLKRVVGQLAFSPDGKTLIIRRDEHHVRLWDVATWTERIPADGPSQAIACLAYSPNAKLVAAGSTGNTPALTTTRKNAGIGRTLNRKRHRNPNTSFMV